MFLQILFICLFLTLLFSQDSAPSSYLSSTTPYSSGEILIKTIRAPISTQSTYYCAFTFSGYSGGNGYSGMQHSSSWWWDSFNFIFSLWDPKNGQQITAAYVHPTTEISRFGGEGSGLKALNSGLGWRIGSWYTIALRRWDVPQDHTLYGMWVKDVTQNIWTHIVTMDYPLGGTFFDGSESSFLEDWTSTGGNVRRFELKDNFKRTSDGVWHPLSQQKFWVNSGDVQPGGRSYNYRNAFDAGVTNEGFYFQTGGNTKNNCFGECILDKYSDNEPKDSPINFMIAKATTTNLEWSVSADSTPQFKITLKINGIPWISEIDSEKRGYGYQQIQTTDLLQLVLEDILGRSSSQSFYPTA